MIQIKPGQGIGAFDAGGRLVHAVIYIGKPLGSHAGIEWHVVDPVWHASRWSEYAWSEVLTSGEYRECDIDKLIRTAT